MEDQELLKKLTARLNYLKKKYNEEYFCMLSLSSEKVKRSPSSLRIRKHISVNIKELKIKVKKTKKLPNKISQFAYVNNPFLNNQESKVDKVCKEIIAYENSGHLFTESFLRLSFLPNQKRFKKLFFKRCVTFNDFLIWSNYSAFLKSINDSSLNKDLFYNHLEKCFINNNAFIKNRRLLLDASVGFSEMPTSQFTKAINSLKKFYTDQKMLSILFSISCEIIPEINLRLLRDVSLSVCQKGSNLNPDWIRRQPKNIKEIHDYYVQCEMRDLNSKIVLKNDYSLNQKNEFLDLHDQKIVIDNIELTIKIPQKRSDLLKFSNLFNNCVGSSDHYAMGCVNQRWSIIGIFNGLIPLYCIQTSKYSFMQANGVHNSPIPKNILQALEEKIVFKHTLPKDFISVPKSFISAYKYNEDEKKLYIIYTKTPDKAYEYYNVPKDLFQIFNDAPKKSSVLPLIKNLRFERIDL